MASTARRLSLPILLALCGAHAFGCGGGSTAGTGGATEGSGGGAGAGSGGGAGAGSGGGPVQGDAWYVSPSGSNADGKTWATAWKELDQIDWSVVKPADRIEIDAGT